MNTRIALAPPLQVAQWFNTKLPLSLEGARGKVVVIHAFQMLCPGCVAEGLPQVKRLRDAFAGRGLEVWGLHTVFEHHQAMSPMALQAFIHEYRLDFPVAVDQPSASGHVPTTMAAWGLRGTPSLILIDRQGQMRMNHFGHLDDMRLGAAVERLLAEPAEAPAQAAEPESSGAQAAHLVGCTEAGCPLPQ